MTKPRAPLSIDGALSRIAGQIPGDWEAMKDIAGVEHKTTVRNWGDEDRPGSIPLPAAIALDIAFQRAGGEGFPLFETYALQLEVAREVAFADEIELARRACTLIRESAQAHEAVVLTSLPSASARDRSNAVRELEDVIREATKLIGVYRGGRSAPDTS